MMDTPTPSSVIEIRTALVKKTPKQSVEIIKRFAEEGNIFAANIYGDMLMEGVWDIKRMQVDLIRGDLQEAAPNDIHDPYLLVARDPLKAVEFYRTAAYSGENCKPRQLARAKLAFCMTKGYAGFTPTEEKNLENTFVKVDVPHSIQKFLTENARNHSIIPASNDTELANSFVPHPNVRPKVVNPKTDVFKHIAARMRDRCLFQIIITQILSMMVFFYSFWRNSIFVMGCILATFTLPLALLAFLDHYSGYRHAMPICSCSKMVAAYKFATKDLPFDCKQDGDPFEKTPAYIRYSHTIKGIYFWFYAIASGIRAFLVLLGLYHNLTWLSGMDSRNPKVIFYITLPLNFLILSLLFVCMDKKITLSHIGQTRDDTDSSNLLYFIIILVMSIISDDKDCELEYNRVTMKKGVDKFVDQLCK